MLTPILTAQQPIVVSAFFYLTDFHIDYYYYLLMDKDLWLIVCSRNCRFFSYFSQSALLQIQRPSYQFIDNLKSNLGVLSWEYKALGRLHLKYLLYFGLNLHVADDTLKSMAVYLLLLVMVSSPCWSSGEIDMISDEIVKLEILSSYIQILIIQQVSPIHNIVKYKKQYAIVQCIYAFKTLIRHQYKKVMHMNFLSIHDLAVAVQHHQNFQHQIKGKRVRKELISLEEYRHEKITFKNFQISTCGISFYVQTQYDYRLFDFQILIDFEYPFNRPRVFYQHQNSPYSNCQDLLDTILEGNNWGPSMLISGILDKLPILSRSLFEQSQLLKTTYHINDYYQEQLLTKYKVDLFNVEEYEWKYMIKSTTVRVLALTKEFLLKFTPEANKLKLDYFVKIKDIKEANASINAGKYKLDITIATESNKKKLYFGGQEADIQKILYFMNPIQAIERKLSKLEKKEYKNEELQEIIQKYSQLIEYYSLRDQEKTKGYVNTIQELIKKSYEQGELKEEKVQIHKEDIKT